MEEAKQEHVVNRDVQSHKPLIIRNTFTYENESCEEKKNHLPGHHFCPFHLEFTFCNVSVLYHFYTKTPIRTTA